MIFITEKKMHPIFDPSKLTDEELLSRITRTVAYVNMQRNLGRTQTVDDSLIILQALEEEQKRRYRETPVLNKKAIALPEVKEKEVVLGELDYTPHPVFIDEGERTRVSKIKRRRI